MEPEGSQEPTTGVVATLIWHDIALTVLQTAGQVLVTYNS
jgi:hypothetical protein